jgi:hypothetical protein
MIALGVLGILIAEPAMARINYFTVNNDTVPVTVCPGDSVFVAWSTDSINWQVYFSDNNNTSVLVTANDTFPGGYYVVPSDSAPFHVLSLVVVSMTGDTLERADRILTNCTMVTTIENHDVNQKTKRCFPTVSTLGQVVIMVNDKVVRVISINGEVVPYEARDIGMNTSAIYWDGSPGWYSIQTDTQTHRVLKLQKY